MGLKTFENMARGEHVLIVALGDSITEQNYHLHGHLNFAGLWNEQLLETFGRQVLFINAGVSGNTTVDLLHRLERDVLRFKPDLVSIMIGINDSGRGMALKEYRGNLEKLVVAIKATGSEVLLMTPHALQLRGTEIASRYHPYPQFIEAIRETAMNKDVVLCDIHKFWEQRVDEHKHLSLMDDYLHPNERGHRLMADILFEKLGLHS